MNSLVVRLMNEIRELNAKIAELMGWKTLWADRRGYSDTWQRPDGSSEYGLLPPFYSTDIAAAYTMEERIAELGLIEEYCFQLNAIANEHKDRDYCRQPQRWQLIHATPEDRCRAALKATEK